VSKKRIVFPCGAYYPVNEWPIDGVHYARDGAVRLMVYPSTPPYDEKRGQQAHCLFECPTKRRRSEQWGFDEHGRRGKYVTCHARLVLDGIDITPPAPARCPHCEEQRTYEQACRKAARRGEEVPERERWGLCPQCSRYRELTADTALCATCQLIKVVESNRG
jgi:hypothetical protein